MINCFRLTQDNDIKNYQSKTKLVFRNKTKNSNERPKTSVKQLLPYNNPIIVPLSSRIVPSDSLYEKQDLYRSNLTLRERVKELIDQNIKLKTQVSRQSKQKKYIISQSISHITHKPFQNGRIMSNFSENVNNIKQLYRNAKLQIINLNSQIKTLLTSIKYTETKQLQVQNQVLQNQTLRLTTYIQNILANNQKQKSYQSIIENLNQQITILKQRNKLLANQKRQFTQEKTKIRQQLTQKVRKLMEKQKRLNKQIQKLVIQNKKIKQSTFQSSQHKKLFSHQIQRTKTCINCIQYKNNIKQLKNSSQLHLLQYQQLKNNSDKIIKLNDQITKIKKQLYQKNQIINKQNIKINELQLQLNQIQIQSQSLKANNQQLNNQLNTIKTQLWAKNELLKQQYSKYNQFLQKIQKQQDNKQAL